MKNEVKSSSKVQGYNAKEIVYIPLGQIIRVKETERDEEDRKVNDADESSIDIQYRPLDSATVKGLVEDIKTRGLINPLLVYNGSKKSVGATILIKEKNITVPAAYLVAGSHRYAALRQIRAADKNVFRQLFPDGVPCVVISGDMSDVMAAQLAENAHRKEATASDILPVLKRLRSEFGLSKGEIAAKINKSPAWVSRMSAVTEELGEEGEEAIKSGKASVRDTMAAAEAVRKARKSGEKLEVSEALKKAKAKSAKKEGGKRVKGADRRVGVATVYKRYQNLPATKVGVRVAILEGCLAYLAGAEDELPIELQTENASKDNED